MVLITNKKCSVTQHIHIRKHNPVKYLNPKTAFGCLTSYFTQVFFFLTPYNWIRGYLKQADQNQDGKMSYDEVKRLLQMINIDLSEQYARSLFKVRVLWDKNKWYRCKKWGSINTQMQSWFRLESKVCLQLPIQQQASHHPPPQLYPSPPLIFLTTLKKSFIFLFRGITAHYVPVTAELLVLYSLSDPPHFKCSQLSWVIEEIFFPQGIWSTPQKQNPTVFHICLLFLPFLLYSFTLLWIPAVRQIWRWPSGSHRDRRVLQGTAAAPRAGRRL